MTPDLALQKAILARLNTASAITALVPAKNILDRNARPNPDPAIVIGEGQTLTGVDMARKSASIILDLHVWKKELGLAGAKAIAGAMRSLLNTRLVLDDGFQCGDCYVSQMRFLRDPDTLHSHAIVTVEALVTETA